MFKSKNRFTAFKTSIGIKLVNDKYQLSSIFKTLSTDYKIPDPGQYMPSNKNKMVIVKEYLLISIIRDTLEE